MKFRDFFILLGMGVVLFCGLIFLLRFGQRNIGKILPSPDQTLPPATPRTAEIPDEIRQKFAAVPEKPTLVAEFKHNNSIKSVEFSPINPALVVSTAFDKKFKTSIELWNINDTNEPIATFTGYSASFSPDGKMLAICGLREGIRLWSIAEERFINTFGSFGDEIAFSPDGQWLASSVTDVQLWDIRTSTTVVKKGPKLSTEGLTEDLAFSQDGKLLAIADTINEEVNIWDITSQERIKTLKNDTWRVEALKFSPESDNPLLIVADDNDEKIRLYSSLGWNEYAAISAKYVNDIAFTPNGKTIVSGGVREVEFWSVENGGRISSIEGYSRWVKSVDISADGNFVVSGDGDGVIRIWDITQYLSSHQIAESDVIKPIYFLPSNREPQPDIAEKVDKLLKDVQIFFADEMERHGLERKTFSFEKDEDGSAKIYLFEGRTTDDYYVKNTVRKVRKEIYRRFDPAKNVYLILVDIRNEKSDKANGIVSARANLNTINYKEHVMGQQGGDVIMLTDSNGHSPKLVSKMLGYACGLVRDFRDASYLMSLGRIEKQLSKSSAEWLNKSRLFNPNQTFFDTPSTVEKLSLLEGKVRFNVKDVDGIHQVRLLVRPTDENPPPGYQRKKDSDENKIDWENKHKGKYFTLYDYVTINAEKETTVEFDFPKFAKNLIRVQVIDGHGNMVYREMNLVDKKESAIRSLIRRIVRGR